MIPGDGRDESGPGLPERKVLIIMLQHLVKKRRNGKAAVVSLRHDPVYG
jgi:hypothetical protein